SLLVVNDTRVLAARLLGRKATGGAVELLLTRMVTRDPDAVGRAEVWEALARNLGREPGERVTFADGLSATVLERREQGRALVRLEDSGGGGRGGERGPRLRPADRGRRDHGRAHAGGGGARRRRRGAGGQRGDQPLPAARRRVPGRDRPHHQLPPAEVHAADAGGGVRGS